MAPARDEVPAEQAAPHHEAVVIGAGVCGIYQLHRLVQLGVDVLCLEGGSDLGGTWYWNRYPGARFDSESYTYGFSFSKELLDEWDWSEHFSGQPENLRYLNFVADKFDLRKHMQFDSRVAAAHFDEDATRWRIELDDGRALTCNVLLTALGLLSAPTLPRLPGIDEFQGQSFHTFHWPEEPVELEGKRVAVIGTGATGVQVIAELAGKVGDLTVFSADRTGARRCTTGPSPPRRWPTSAPATTRSSSAAPRPRAASSTAPTAARSRRSHARSASRCGTSCTSSPASASGWPTSATSSWTRRPTPSSRPTWPTRSASASTLGMLVSGFPNLLTVAGPQSGSVSTNFPRGIETAVDWATELLQHMWEQGYTRVEATPEAEAEWTQHVADMYQMMLMRNARSWFTGYNSNVEGHEQGRIRYMVYNGGAPKYRKKLTEVADSGYDGLTFS